MTALLNRVCRQVDESCIVKGGLKKDGCGVAMTGAPSPRIVIDLDKPGSPLPQNATRCDYLLIAESSDAFAWVAALELKRGQLDASHVVRQLRAGAAAAEKLVPQSEEVRFLPIVASGGTPKHERIKLKNKASRIGFHGKKQAVRLMSCGTPLATALG